ncbi:hypothetical protein TNCV_1573501 [Trichonephila clavipes]|nr:hypothetical protein TNCV_1573501 [Trichonephila clavipes]
MSLSSFRVQQDATGHQSIASTEKRDEHPPLSACGRMSLSSFRVHQDATGQHSSVLDEKRIRKPTVARRRGRIRCHRSACNKTRPDSRVVPRRKKVTNTHRRAATVGCRCHRSACTKTRPDSRVVPGRKRRTPTAARTSGRINLSSFRVHQDATDSRVVPDGKNGTPTAERLR